MGSLRHIVEDCRGILQVFSDGSVYRSKNVDLNIPLHQDDTVIWKDCLYDKTHNLHLRLYKTVLKTNPPTKLPIIFYIHGGGFCFGSRTWPNIRNTCLRLSSSLGALVVSPDYRLAPEHRLPAAVDDVMSCLKWVQRQAKSENCDVWLRDGRVDFDRVFIVGDSSGGNIAHHLAVRLGLGLPELVPVRIRGYVLMAPFFGGTKRTNSEERSEEMLLNLDILDRFWRLSLPVGASADHPIANPFGPGSPSLEQVKLDPILVVVGGGELLKDRAMDYATRLKELKKKIDYVEFAGKQHGFFMHEPYSEVGDRVIQVIKTFMAETSN